MLKSSNYKIFSDNKTKYESTIQALPRICTALVSRVNMIAKGRLGYLCYPLLSPRQLLNSKKGTHS